MQVPKIMLSQVYSSKNFTEDYAVSGVQFEELHRRLSTSKKMIKLHRFNLLIEGEWSEGDDPSKVYCRRKAIGSVIRSEEN